MVFTIRTVIEVLGFPDTHVKEVTTKVIEKLKTEEGITTIKTEIHPPEKVKDRFYSCFAEIEIKVHNFSRLLSFCYDYMPSSLEILDMEKVTMPIREFTFGLNELLERLHTYNITINNLSAQLNNQGKNDAQNEEDAVKN